MQSLGSSGRWFRQSIGHADTNIGKACDEKNSAVMLEGPNAKPLPRYWVRRFEHVVLFFC